MSSPRGPGGFWKLAAAGFAFKLVSTFSQVLGQAVFLKVAGSARLPYNYIAVSVIAAAQGVLSYRGSRAAGALVWVGAPAVGLCCLAQGLGWGGDPVWRVFGLFTGICVIDIFAGIMFWNTINETLTIAQLRRVVGFLGGWMHLGGLLAGAATLPLMAWVSADRALIACGLLYLLAPVAVALRGVAGRAGPAADAGDGAGPGAAAPGDRAPGDESAAPDPDETALLELPLVRAALVTTACAAALRYLISYDYSVVIEGLFDTPERLAGFVGLFDAGVKVLVLATQWLVIGRLAAKRTLGGLMTPTPSVVAFMAGGFLVTGLPLWILGGHLLFQVMAKSVDQAALNRMLCAFQGTDRRRTSFLLQGVLFPVVVVLAGFVLLAFPGPDYLVARWVLIAGLAGLALVATRAIDPAYRALLLENLAAGRVTGEGATPLGALHPEVDEAEITGGEPAAFFELDDEAVVAALGRTTDPRARATLVKLLMRRESTELLRRVLGDLGEDPDPRVLANAIEALGEEGRGPWIPAAIRAHHAHPNPRVKGAVVTTTVQTTKEVPELTAALEDLRDLLRSADPGDRVAGVVVLGEFGLDAFGPALASRLADPDPAVRRVALKAARRFPSQVLLPAVEARLGAEDDREVAAELRATAEFLRDEDMSAFTAISFTWPVEAREQAISRLRALDDQRQRRLSFRWAALTGPGSTAALMRHLPRLPGEQARRLAACVRTEALDADPLVADYLARPEPGPQAEILEALAGEEPGAVATALERAAGADRTWHDAELRRLLEVVGWLSGEDDAAADLAESLGSPEARRRDLGLEALEALGFPGLRAAMAGVIKRMRAG